MSNYSHIAKNIDCWYIRIFTRFDGLLKKFKSNETYDPEKILKRLHEVWDH